jgi:hypothetical protein
MKDESLERSSAWLPTVALVKSREQPLALHQESGMSLGMLMLAVTLLRKSSRMTDISEKPQ